MTPEQAYLTMADTVSAREHGGNVYRASQETGIPVNDIMDFSASINPLGVPASVVTAIQENIRLLPHYPEPQAEQLSERLGRHLQIDGRTILCGNGSTELIYLLPRTLRPRRALIPAPTFSEYNRACALAEACIVEFPLSCERGFEIDPDRFIAAMDGCDMAFLCNPNNPTGRLLNRDAVLRIAKAADRLSCWLVVDEAFIDFIPGHSVADAVSAHTRLIVLRSLTKFYALSGLRIGFGVFPQALLHNLRDRKEPWTVNSLALCAATAAIQDERFQEATHVLIAEEKAYLENALSTAGIAYFPSAANYYLLQMDRAQEALASLRAKGILVRDCSNFPGLDSTYLRIAVRRRTENEALLRELTAS